MPARFAFEGTRASFRRSAIVGLFLSAVLAGAQGPSDQDLMSLSIEELAKTNVYSASRHLEDPRVAPSAVSIVSSEEIARYGWRTLGDILNSVRGFYTSYDRDYTYLGVRGVQRPGDYNSRILLMVNGHRLNDNVYDGALLGNEFPLDLDRIDHIEIVRGPSSSLYGTNAIFGIVNVITRRPKGGTSIEASGDSSSFLGRTGRLTGTYQKGRLSALLSGSLYRSAGQSDLFFPEFAATNRGVAVNLDGDRYTHTFADVQYGGLRVQGLFGTRTKILPTAAYSTNFDDPGTRTTDTRAYFDANYHRSLTSNTDLDVRAYYDAYRFEATYVFGSSPNRNLNFDRVSADWTGVEATVGHKMGRQRITAGANYEYSFRADQQNYNAGQPPLVNDHRTPWRAAAYGEAELNVIPKLTIHAGGRFDWFDPSGLVLSPRVAVVYQPNSRTALKYVFAKAFRAPNVYENYYSDGSSLIAPSTPLKAEHIGAHEVIFERSLTSWLRITADGFANDLKNLIDEVPNPVSGVDQFVNSGHDRGRGVEFELGAMQESGLSARASYTFSDTQNRFLHSALANSPSNMVKLHGTLPASRRAFAGLELLYTSGQTSYQGTPVPYSFLTNFTFSTTPLWGTWELSASCYNTLNQHWSSPAGPGLVQAAIPQDGRTYRFKISYRLPIGKARSK